MLSRNKKQPRYVDISLLNTAELDHESTAEIDDAIAKLPTVDVVEVVRCKACIWWEPDAYGSSIGRCENPHNGLAREYSDEDDYCSYGKRSENGT